MAKILVAVPDRDERELYIFALRFAGHQLSGAGDMPELALLLAQRQPDLILFDAHWLGEADQAGSSIPPEITDGKVPLIYVLDRNITPGRLAWSKSARHASVTRPISLDQLTRRVNETLKRSSE